MIISAIAAVSKNGVIGADGQIPWYLPADLKYFKKTTLHHHILMGRKTFESIGMPLPKRTNIVVTRNPFFIASNLLIVNSVEEGIELAIENGESELFIIGGGQIYKDSISYWDRIYLTEVDLEVNGEVYFPSFNETEWNLVASDYFLPDDKNEVAYTFKIFHKK